MGPPSGRPPTLHVTDFTYHLCNRAFTSDLSTGFYLSSTTFCLVLFLNGHIIEVGGRFFVQNLYTQKREWIYVFFTQENENVIFYNVFSG